jgi:hypothetical protein
MRTGPTADNLRPAGQPAHFFHVRFTASHKSPIDRMPTFSTQQQKRGESARCGGRQTAPLCADSSWEQCRRTA